MDFLRFKGTADKSEFWSVFRVIVIIGIVVQFIGSFIQNQYMNGVKKEHSRAIAEQQQSTAVADYYYHTASIAPSEKISMTVAIICSILSLLMVPTYVRRLHDRNKSGFWMFLALIPLLGGLYLLLECGFMESVEEGNKYQELEFAEASGSMEDKYDALWK